MLSCRCKGLTPAHALAGRHFSFAISFVLPNLKFCSSAALSEWSVLLYGLSAGLMWLRTLNFVLVQQDLGQVLAQTKITISFLLQNYQDSVESTYM
jgi:hypothetical protein